jgi:hypothetical protein
LATKLGLLRIDLVVAGGNERKARVPFHCHSNLLVGD